MARIAVIGAGMGAMATAARLAVAGHQVTVYERGTTYGGAVGRYERDGFAFDTGPGLLHLPAVYRDLFVKTGKRPLEDCVDMVQLDPAVRHVLDGTAVTLPGASRGGVATALDEAFGAGAGERWNDLLGRARDTWDATRRPLLEEPLRSDWQVLGRDPYPALRGSGLLRRRPPTLAEVARRELGGGLGELLAGRVLAYGLDPDAVPAAAAALPYMEQTFGSWYVRGGMRELATAVYERCRERKVEFVFGGDVRSVLTRDGRAAGVRLADGTEAAADQVVCGIDPRQLPGGSVPRPRGGVPAQGGEAPGRLTLLLALSGARPADAVPPHAGALPRHGRRPAGHGAAPRRPRHPARRGPRGGHRERRVRPRGRGTGPGPGEAAGPRRTGRPRAARAAAVAGGAHPGGRGGGHGRVRRLGAGARAAR
ncbi:phytoene dehydrogenase [Streptomyces sp. C]|nr:phytoene dehydrogenase [Streptomyces sp. C]